MLQAMALIAIFHCIHERKTKCNDMCFRSKPYSDNLQQQSNMQLVQMNNDSFKFVFFLIKKKHKNQFIIFVKN